MNRDPADVGLAHVANPGRSIAQLDERLPVVEVFVQLPEVGAIRGRHVTRHELTLVERQQVRGERDLDRCTQGLELLLDLGRVSVARHAVGVHVLIDGHEMGLVAGRSAGPRDA